MASANTSVLSFDNGKVNVVNSANIWTKPQSFESSTVVVSEIVGNPNVIIKCGADNEGSCYVLGQDLIISDDSTVLNNFMDLKTDNSIPSNQISFHNRLGNVATGDGNITCTGGSDLLANQGTIKVEGVIVNLGGNIPANQFIEVATDAVAGSTVLSFHNLGGSTAGDVKLSSTSSGAEGGGLLSVEALAGVDFTGTVTTPTVDCPSIVSTTNGIDISVSGGMTINAGSMNLGNVTGGNYYEMALTGYADGFYIDNHCAGGNVDYDSRIIYTRGDPATSGSGTIYTSCNTWNLQSINSLNAVSQSDAQTLSSGNISYFMSVYKNTNTDVSLFNLDVAPRDGLRFQAYNFVGPQLKFQTVNGESGTEYFRCMNNGSGGVGQYSVVLATNQFAQFYSMGGYWIVMMGF
jgi:hypothetical protein